MQRTGSAARKAADSFRVRIGRAAPFLELFHHPPDTLFGAPSWRRPDHPLRRIVPIRFEPRGLHRDVARSALRAADRDAEKRGYERAAVRHPFSARRSLPVYVANFILMEYGTGAIFGCPAHDQRDLDFARKYWPAR
jgi:leucyl-tRNA synthetase